MSAISNFPQMEGDLFFFENLPITTITKENNSEKPDDEKMLNQIKENFDLTRKKIKNFTHDAKKRLEIDIDQVIADLEKLKKQITHYPKQELLAQSIDHDIKRAEVKKTFVRQILKILNVDSKDVPLAVLKQWKSKKIVILNKIIEGGNKTVYKIIHLATEKLAAMSTYELITTRQEVFAESEAKMLMCLQGEGVIKCLEIFKEEVDKIPYQNIVMDLADDDLFNLISRAEKANSIEGKWLDNPLTVQKIVLNMLKTIDRFHSQEKCIHGDIKPENIVYFAKEDGPEIAFIDFDCTRHFDDEERQKTIMGSIDYLPPEYLKAIILYHSDDNEGAEALLKASSQKLDAYSAGLTIFELCRNRLCGHYIPLLPSKYTKIKHSVGMTLIFLNKWLENLYFNFTISEKKAHERQRQLDLRSLEGVAFALLNADPELRLSIRDAIEIVENLPC